MHHHHQEGALSVGGNFGRLCMCTVGCNVCHLKCKAESAEGHAGCNSQSTVPQSQDRESQMKRSGHPSSCYRWCKFSYISSRDGGIPLGSNIEQSTPGPPRRQSAAGIRLWLARVEERGWLVLLPVATQPPNLSTAAPGRHVSVRTLRIQNMG